MSNRKTTVRFSDQVPAQSTTTLTRTVTSDATVELVEVRIYPGPQLDLAIRPFKRTDEGDRIPLVAYEGREEIVGDDDKFTLYSTVGLAAGDDIVVEAENNDGSNAYNFSVDITVDGLGGQRRVEGNVAAATGSASDGLPALVALDLLAEGGA